MSVWAVAAYGHGLAGGLWVEFKIKFASHGLPVTQQDYTVEQKGPEVTDT